MAPLLPSALAIGLIIGPALAQAAPSRPVLPASRPTEVSGVTVVAARPVDPRVVSSFPADGGAVPFGMVVVKLVFDQPMTPEAWSYGRSPEGEFPDCLARPRLLDDRRTVVLLCSLSGGRSFALRVNAAPDFVSRSGRSAKPTLLRFTTTTDNTVSLHDALQRAGLTDADSPIMTWNGVAGVSASPPRPRGEDPPPPPPQP